MIDGFKIKLDFSVEDELKKQQREIHIRVHRKSKRQCITLIEGLDKLELLQNQEIHVLLESFAKKLRKLFNCGVTIKKPENVIQLMGDHGEGMKQYLISNNIVEESQIVLHMY